MTTRAKAPHRDPIPGLKGVVEIEVRHKGTLIDRFVEKNIVLYQGNGEVIRTLASVSPSTAPRIINRIAVGDQGTIPADSTVPKVPTKDLTALYHEIYRKDIEARNITINPGTTFTTAATLVSGSPLATTASTVGLASGMTVSGTGIPLGTTILIVNSSTQFTLSQNATVSGAQTLTISGAANEAQFIATFNVADVPLSSYSNPSQPRINEVGLVIINPVAVDGIPRTDVAAPNSPPADEVLMTVRCFKSVPFELANDVAITIRYTIFME
jgi:hypothetical protein